MTTLVQTLCVAIGGALGALSRWGCLRAAEILAPGSNQWLLPLGTIAPNLIGSLCLGLLAERFSRLAAAGATFWPLLIATGFFGAFTTFSTFSVQAMELFQRRGALAAFGSISLHVLLGLAAAGCGLWLGRKL